MRKYRIDPSVRCFLLISLSFTWASAAYLSWLYRLTELVSPATADVLTEVAGYLFQAAGIGLFALACSRWRAAADGLVFAVMTALALLCAVPAAVGASLALVLPTGFLMNLLIGGIAGFYLHRLAELVPARRRALVFGGGYGAASFATWLMSLPGAGSFLHSPRALILCALLAAGSILFVSYPAGEAESPAGAAPAGADAFPPLACVTVLLLSLVKSLGNSFPSYDVLSGVSLELTRVFYGVGLVAAGLVSDRGRRYGAICCFAALVMPFLTLLMSAASVSASIVWCVSYLMFSFFTVYRVVLFSDIAAESGRLPLAGLGLLFGRVGDAVGAGLCIALRSSLVPLAAITAALFILTVFLFFRLYMRLYAAAPVPRKSERELFESFAAGYGLSAREREVLRLLLEDRSNTEIAAALFVSDSTVKFHVHNLLKKTGCKNRLELTAKYASAD